MPPGIVIAPKALDENKDTDELADNISPSDGSFVLYDEEYFYGSRPQQKSPGSPKVKIATDLSFPLTPGSMAPGTKSVFSTLHSVLFSRSPFSVAVGGGSAFSGRSKSISRSIEPSSLIKMHSFLAQNGLGSIRHQSFSAMVDEVEKSKLELKLENESTGRTKRLHTMEVMDTIAEH